MHWKGAGFREVVRADIEERLRKYLETGKKDLVPGFVEPIEDPRGSLSRGELR